MQAILGTKEGVAKGLTTKLGHNVIDGALLTADIAHYKSVDDYELHTSSSRRCSNMQTAPTPTTS